MRRFLVLVFAVFVFLSLSLPVFAQEDELLVVAEDEVVDRDFYGGAGRVEIYGTINGDVYTAGGQVLVDGRVNGDVLAAGGMIDIGGVVSQDVRIVGGQLTVSGEVGKNVTFAGGNVTLTDGARIGGNVLGAGGNVNVASPIARNLTVGVGNLTLSSQVGGDVEAGVGTLRLTPEAEILGDLTYWSDSEASIAEGSVVSGEILKKEPKSHLETGLGKEAGTKGLKSAGKGIKTFFNLTSLVSSLIVGLILIWLFPRFIQGAGEMIGKKPLSVLGLGLIGLVVAPLALLILLITIVGIPISLMLFFFYVLSIYLSKIFASIFVGGMILSWLKVKAKLGWVFIIGLAIYFVVRNVALIGWLAALLSLVFGLGAFWLALRESWLAGSKKR